MVGRHGKRGTTAPRKESAVYEGMRVKYLCLNMGYPAYLVMQVLIVVEFPLAFGW